MFSQEQPVSRRIDSLFQMVATYQLLNGAAQITVNGHTIYKSSFGYSDFATNKPNRETTSFALGSVIENFYRNGHITVEGQRQVCAR